MGPQNSTGNSLPGLILGLSQSNPSPQRKPHQFVLRTRVFLLIKLKRHQCSGNMGLMLFGPGRGLGKQRFCGDTLAKSRLVISICLTLFM